MPDSQINVAIVGFGNIAQARHMGAIKEKGGRVSAVLEKNRKLKESPIEGAKLFRSILKAKEDTSTKIDAVAICTRPKSHFRLAKQALKAGYHVLLEKPPVLNLHELDELEQLAKEKGKVLFLAYHTASSPAVQQLQKILKSKQVLQIEANFFEEVTMWHNPKEWIFKKDESGGGITMDIGINAFSAICRTMPNASFRLVDCNLESEMNYPVDTKAKIVIEDTVSGAKGEINLNWFNGRENEDVRRIKYTTDGGVYILNLTTARLFEKKEGEEVEIETGREQEYEKVYEEFYRSIEQGKSYIPREEITFIKNVYALDERKRKGTLPLS